MQKLKALLIDDDRKFCESFKMLAETTFDLTVVHSGQDGLNELKKFKPDAVFLDLKLGRGMNGLQVLQKIKQIDKDLPVIMVTDYANVETAVEAMKMGAFHYTSKSPNIEALKLIIERQHEQIRWKKIYEQEQSEREIPCVAVSPLMKKALHKIKTVAPIDSTVLIEGECGVGKEVCARQIHQFSRRKDNPFIAVNCSTLSPQLFESEFFGHEKGAFTDAHIQKKGKLEIADTGTIFLDEIGDLPLESQAKILRAVEEKRFERLGGTESLKIDVRIIAASNKDLKKLVEQKQFREDLFYRLSVISLYIPPLRERQEDIPALAQLFLQRFSEEMRRPLPILEAGAIEKMINYHMPGNVRELKNFIERLIVFHQSSDPILAKDIKLEQQESVLAYTVKLLGLPYEEAKRWLLNDFKKIYFQQALDRNKGNVSATSVELGINRSAFHKMLKELKLNYR